MRWSTYPTGAREQDRRRTRRPIQTWRGALYARVWIVARTAVWWLRTSGRCSSGNLRTSKVSCDTRLRWKNLQCVFVHIITIRWTICITFLFRPAHTHTHCNWSDALLLCREGKCPTRWVTNEVYYKICHSRILRNCAVE